MGINPLMSIISSLAEQADVGFGVEVLYSTKDPGGEREADGMLFVERIANIFAREKLRGDLKLFLTTSQDVDSGDGPDDVACNEVEVPFLSRRITADDINAAAQDLATSVIYVCGVPAMTDQFVAHLTSKDNSPREPARVLFEKWW